MKYFPDPLRYRIKLATASLVFILISVLFTGNVSEVQIALPIQNDAVSVYSQIPEEEIDYEEYMNRLPLRKPAPKPHWLEWMSESRRQVVSS